MTLENITENIHKYLKQIIENLDKQKSMSFYEKIERAFRDTTSLEEGIKIGSKGQIEHPIDHSPAIQFIHKTMAQYAQNKISHDKTWQLMLEYFK